MRTLTALLACSLFTVVIALAQDNPGQDADITTPTTSINDLMIDVITPATNTLWGIEDPQTAGDWQPFIDAADVVIAAAQTMKLGGTGPNDNDWSASPAWQAFADALTAAGRDARQAAIDHDIDAMFTAGEVLYPPCEECHNQFHPGVAGQ